MQKQTLLFLSMFFVTVYCYAQKDEDYNLSLGKFKIVLMQNSDGSYGYQIHESGKLIIHQKVKPYSFMRKGFKEKQNAISIALWHTGELKAGQSNLRNMSIKKARELYITEIDLKD